MFRFATMESFPYDFNVRIVEDVKSWCRALLLAKHCELVANNDGVNWAQVRLVFCMCLKERLAGYRMYCHHKQAYACLPEF